MEKIVTGAFIKLESWAEIRGAIHLLPALSFWEQIERYHASLAYPFREIRGRNSPFPAPPLMEQQNWVLELIKPV